MSINNTMMNVFIMFGTYIHLTQVYKNVGEKKSLRSEISKCK